MQRRWLYLISDCHVIRSLECYSDQKLVCLTYNLALPIAKRQQRRRTTQCFAVGDLISAVRSLVDDVVVASSTQAAYCQALQGHLAERPIESSIKDKWNRLKYAVLQSAETAVGRARHRQLDWFLDTASTCEPTLSHRNDPYRLWVGSGSHADHEAFATARRYSHFPGCVAKHWWLKTKADFVDGDRCIN